MEVKTSLPWIFNKPLNELTTLAIGGPAKYFIAATTISTLLEAILFSRQNTLPFIVIGKGSNSLFQDSGYPGVVIQNKIDFLERIDNLTFKVGAGHSFAHLGVVTAREGLHGLEFASGIPASVGGAVFMNAGANGAETKDCLISVEYLEEDGTIKSYVKEELIFSYRFSPFQNKKGAILSATFALTPLPSAREKQIDIVRYRKKTQPYGEHSAGCVFQNPAGCIAGKLIQECGLKGFSIGDAQVSTLHGNFLINRGNATAEEFKMLMQHVQRVVKEQTGIDLHPEVRVIE